MLEKALINSTIDSVILKLKENDRITGEEIEQLQKSFDSQNLVIGVVGKMKLKLPYCLPMILET